MKRSVIQLAGRTLLVSLPSKWADSNNVKKGDELELTEDGHKLIVNTQKPISIEKAEINADVVGAFVRRYVFALYKKGIDEIKITYSDPNTADVIRDTVLNQTVGFEIVSQTPTSCIVKLVTSGNIIDFDNILRRIFLILLSMSEEIVSSVKNNNFEHLAKVGLLEKTNNRLTTLCRRSLNKLGTTNFNKVGPIYHIIEELENLADEYRDFCNDLLSLKNHNHKTIKPEIFALLEGINEAFRIFYETFYKFDIVKLTKLASLTKDLINRSHKLISSKKLSAAEIYTTHHALVIVRRIFKMTGPQLVLLN